MHSPIISNFIHLFCLISPPRLCCHYFLHRISSCTQRNTQIIMRLISLLYRKPARWLPNRTLSSTARLKNDQPPPTREKGLTPCEYTDRLRCEAHPMECVKTSLAIVNSTSRTETVLNLSRDRMHSQDLTCPGAEACKSVTTREQYCVPVTVWASLW